MLQAAYIERLPTKLRYQFAYDLLRSRIIAGLHHHWLHIVAGIGRVLKIFETIDRKRLHNLGFGHDSLNHFRTGLSIIQSVTQVGANWVGAVYKNLAPYLISNCFECCSVGLKWCSEEDNIRTTDRHFRYGNSQVGVSCQSLSYTFGIRVSGRQHHMVTEALQVVS